MPVANRVESFAVVCTAGTLSTSPATIDTSFDDGNVVRVELDVPAGHSGYTGVQILAAGAQYLPKTDGVYLIADDHQFGWDTLVTIDTGAWSLRCYNEDSFDHTFYVRFSVLDFGFTAAPAPPAVLTPTPLLV